MARPTVGLRPGGRRQLGDLATLLNSSSTGVSRPKMLTSTLSLSWSSLISMTSPEKSANGPSRTRTVSPISYSRRGLARGRPAPRSPLGMRKARRPGGAAGTAWGPLAHEAGHARGVADDEPGGVVQLGPDQQVAGEHLALGDDPLAVLEVDVVLHGDDDLVDGLLGVHRVDAGLEVLLDLLLVARLGVDDEPAAGPGERVVDTGAARAAPRRYRSTSPSARHLPAGHIPGLGVDLAVAVAVGPRRPRPTRPRPRRRIGLGSGPRRPPPRPRRSASAAPASAASPRRRGASLAWPLRHVGGLADVGCRGDVGLVMVGVGSSFEQLEHGFAEAKSEGDVGRQDDHRDQHDDRVVDDLWTGWATPPCAARPAPRGGTGSGRCRSLVGRVRRRPLAGGGRRPRRAGPAAAACAWSVGSSP